MSKNQQARIVDDRIVREPHRLRADFMLMLVEYFNEACDGYEQQAARAEVLHDEIEAGRADAAAAAAAERAERERRIAQDAGALFVEPKLSPEAEAMRA